MVLRRRVGLSLVTHGREPRRSVPSASRSLDHVADPAVPAAVPAVRAASVLPVPARRARAVPRGRGVAPGRDVARRVHPFIAVSAATLFALFGAGSDNIINPFQVTFTGAFVAGLVMVLLTDHDGPLGRRDAFGLLAGLVGLMMSGVGVVMVMIMGIAVLLRRGWRTALKLVAPLAAIYLVWFVAIGHDDGVTQAGSLSQIGGIVTGGIPQRLPDDRRARPLVGAADDAAARRRVRAAARQRTKAGWGSSRCPLRAALRERVAPRVGRVRSRRRARHERRRFPRQSRYVSLIAAMSIPALAVAADALTRAWKWLLPIAMAMFLVRDPAQPGGSGPPSGSRRRSSRERDSRSRSFLRSPTAARCPVTPSGHPHRARSHRRLAPRRARAGQDPVARADDADQPRQGRLPPLLPAGTRLCIRAVLRAREGERSSSLLDKGDTVCTSRPSRSSPAAGLHTSASIRGMVLDPERFRKRDPSRARSPRAASSVPARAHPPRVCIK